MIDLAGDLTLNPIFADECASDLEARIHNAAEVVRESLFEIGDATLVLLHRAGSRPSDRALVVKDLVVSTGVSYGLIRKAIRVVRAFPYGFRDEFSGQSQTWFEIITDRSALPGDEPNERVQRQQALARECADLNSRETRDLIEQKLQPHKTRGELLDPYDEPAPLPPCPVLEVPTHEAPDLVERFTKGLEKRLIHEKPGPWSDIAEVVRMFLLERVAQGWRLEAPR